MQNTPLFCTSFCWVTLCSRIFHYWQMHRESCFSETKVPQNVEVLHCLCQIIINLQHISNWKPFQCFQWNPSLCGQSSNMVSLSAWRPLFSSWWNAHTFSDKKKSGQRLLVEMSACVKFYNFTLLIRPLQAVMFIFPVFILYVCW